MSELLRKHNRLEAAGFVYNFERDIYVNRQTKKRISVEFLEDHEALVIGKCIEEDVAGEDWKFYFNATPAASVVRQLESVLG